MIKLLSGDDLSQKLIKLLGLPESTISFDLHFADNELPVVKCSYFPKDFDADAELLPIIAEFYLVPK